MNTAIHLNLAVIKAEPIWKKMGKTQRWTFLGQWEQEDETIFREMYDKDPTTKPTPGFVKHNKDAKSLSDSNRNKRKNRGQRTEDGDQMAFYSFGGGKRKKGLEPVE
jgi:hypothetical protein